jgi:peptide/nickel transport system permease protein
VTKYKAWRWLRNLGILFPFVILGLALLLSITEPLLPLDDPFEQDHTAVLEPPSSDHILGTDHFGRDLLARIARAIRNTVLASVVTVIVASVIAVPAGLLAGYRRGLIDSVALRIADLIQAIPNVVVVLAAAAALRAGIYTLMAILGVMVAAPMFRVIRSTVLNLTNASFVIAGRMSGIGNTRLLIRYLLPNVREQISVQVAIMFGLALVVEAGVSYIGAGIQPPDASLGRLISDAVLDIRFYPHLAIVPGAILTCLSLCALYAGDHLGGRQRDG